MRLASSGARAVNDIGGSKGCADPRPLIGRAPFGKGKAEVVKRNRVDDHGAGLGAGCGFAGRVWPSSVSERRLKTVVSAPSTAPAGESAAPS